MSPLIHLQHIQVHANLTSARDWEGFVSDLNYVENIHAEDNR